MMIVSDSLESLSLSPGIIKLHKYNVAIRSCTIYYLCLHNLSSIYIRLDEWGKKDWSWYLKRKWEWTPTDNCDWKAWRGRLREGAMLRIVWGEENTPVIDLIFHFHFFLITIFLLPEWRYCLPFLFSVAFSHLYILAICLSLSNISVSVKLVLLVHFHFSLLMPVRISLPLAAKSRLGDYFFLPCVHRLSD